VHRRVFAAGLAIALSCPATGGAQPAASAPSAATAKPAASAPPAATGQPAASAAPAQPPPSTATAQPIAPVTPVAAGEGAGRTFQQGREAFKANDFARALELFKQSQALEASPGTLLNIALTEEKLGRTASAWQNFQLVVEQFKADDDRMPIAKDGVARTAPRVPRIKIERAAGSPPTLSIKVDGSPLAANLVGAEQALDPGAHVVTTLVPGFDERRYDVTLTEGQRIALVVEPGKRTLVAAPVGPISPVVATGWSSPQMAALGLVGAGVAGLGVGLATGLFAVAKKGELDAACPEPPACSAGGRRIEGEARSFANVSTGTLIFGGVAAVGGVVVLLVTSAGKSAQVSTSAGSGGAFASAKLRF
jgi:hypothetical protein